MPPRKDTKEAVIYPASKRKPLPFKPQRPSKVPRTQDDASSSFSRPTATSTASRTAAKHKRPTNTNVDDDDDDDDDDNDNVGYSGAMDGNLDEEPVISTTAQGASDRPENLSQSSSDSDLPADPRQRPKKKPPPKAPPVARKSQQRQPSVAATARSDSSPPDELEDETPVPSQSNSIPTVPQPLLVRLLYEHFVDKSTKIDKHAIQVAQKYVEIFVREAVARTALRKKEDAESREAEGASLGDIDPSWLELEDLEKVAASMMLDF